jgi:hypothetical protein
MHMDGLGASVSSRVVVLLRLVIGITALMLALSGFARAAPAIQGVHGGGLLTRLGFTDEYAVSVTRQPSGSLSGHIRAAGGTWMVQASPNGLSILGDTACITGEVERGFSDLGTPESIVVLIADVADGRDLIASALLDGPAGDPPFACAPLARALVLPPIPELTAGNFTLIGN